MNKENNLTLSGLEPLVVSKASNFINIGERTNVTGSKKFLRLIENDKYSEALEVARDQVEGGAQASTFLGGPLKHKIGDFMSFLNFKTAICSIIRFLTSFSP